MENDINLDIVESNITLDNLGGVLGVPKGGTGLNSLTDNRFLVGDGINPVDLTKIVPVGDVVGTTDTQTLTNKTLTNVSNNVLARGLWYDSGSGFISTFGSTVPTTGDVLVATSTTTAEWQSIGIYGSEFEYIESLNTVSTTLELNISGISINGGTFKTSWTTASKPVGTYRIDWSYDWTVNSNSRDIITIITLDGTSTSDIKHQFRSGVTSNAGGFDTADFALSNSGTDQRHNNSGFFYAVFGAAGTHTLSVVFGRGTTGAGFDSVTMSDLRLQILRVA